MEVYEEGGLVRPRELRFAEERAHDREPNRSPEGTKSSSVSYVTLLD
jgi:hypothetical protein